MLHDLELNFIHFIHEFRVPHFDQFFKFLNFFDRMEFFYIFIPFVWLRWGWKMGLRVLCILLLSKLSNHTLKHIFLSPRPFHIDPSVGIIQVKGWGFPSGAAQTVILLSGILINAWKSAWKWVVALSYIVLISFSRIYLGLHFPSDILAGWVVGFGLWAVYTYVFPPLEEHLGKLKIFSKVD